jgi:BirA family biotin operon repressor/biotin-[acetyl-CoA-carboxylase] ligase
MRSPLDEGPWLFLDTVHSTQDTAALLLGHSNCPGIVLAEHQEAGRGRFGRPWSSERGRSLTMSLVYRSYASHPKPWLLGMAVAIAVAKAVEAQVRWPNDVVIERRKLAGVLTELFPAGRDRKVPVIGVGVNLEQPSLPDDIAATATSLFDATGVRHDARALAQKIVAEIAALPEPDDWSALAAEWAALDNTPGKEYRLPTGETALALSVGDEGTLLCTVDGIERRIMAADALLPD